MMSDEQVPETVVEAVTGSTGVEVKGFPETVGNVPETVGSVPEEAVQPEQPVFPETPVEVTLVPVDPALVALVDVPRSDRKIVAMPSLIEVLTAQRDRLMEQVAKDRAERGERDWDAAAAELMESEGGLPDDD